MNGVTDQYKKENWNKTVGLWTRSGILKEKLFSKLLVRQLRRPLPDFNMRLSDTRVWLPFILPLRRDFWDRQYKGPSRFFCTSCVTHLAHSVPIPLSGVSGSLVEIWKNFEVRFRLTLSELANMCAEVVFFWYILPRCVQARKEEGWGRGVQS